MRVGGDRLVRALLAGALIAVLVAAWFGVSWALAASDDDLAYGRERDVVLTAAEDGLATLHTVDHRRAARDLDAWLTVTSGGLRKDIAGDRDGQLRRAASSKTVASAKVIRAAITELDKHGGTARVIAVVDVRLSTSGGKPATQRRRMNADLVLDGSAWKISAVEAAA